MIKRELFLGVRIGNQKFTLEEYSESVLAMVMLGEASIEEIKADIYRIFWQINEMFNKRHFDELAILVQCLDKLDTVPETTLEEN